jgi:MoxR-like ATPase
MDQLRPSLDIELINQQVYLDSAFLEPLETEIGRFVVGQKHMVTRLLTGLLSQGHILLEGLPGLAKTLAIKTLAGAIDADFSRIQFTPDLLPSDIVGTMVYHPGQNQFSVRKGPVFANFILADEINRAPAKVQSALLEAMQEKQVTIGSETFRLEEPFLVLATQNPLEQEGTYPLPEAQLDRFMLKVLIGYPGREEEKQIIRMHARTEPAGPIQKVITPDVILKARKTVSGIYMDEKVENYILDLVFATRDPGLYRLSSISRLIQYGASPRASINLALAARATAFLHRRGYVIPDDVRQISKDVLRHRIGLTYEAEADNVTTDEIIHQILQSIPVP